MDNEKLKQAEEALRKAAISAAGAQSPKLSDEAAWGWAHDALDYAILAVELLKDADK